MAPGTHLTFELYVDDGSRPPVFEPFTCSRRADLMPAALQMIEARHLRAIEVRECGEHLFTLRGSAAGAVQRKGPDPVGEDRGQ